MPAAANNNMADASLANSANALQANYRYNYYYPYWRYCYCPYYWWYNNYYYKPIYAAQDANPAMAANNATTRKFIQKGSKVKQAFIEKSQNTTLAYTPATANLADANLAMMPASTNTDLAATNMAMMPASANANLADANIQRINPNNYSYYPYYYWNYYRYCPWWWWRNWYY